MNKVLRVDLSEGTHKVEPLEAELRSSFIGGRGVAVRMLCDEIDPGIDPLIPENKLILATGPLTGTGAITGCKYVVVTKSPLTGAIATSSSEGFFGSKLKYAGYDMLIVEGRAEDPVYIDISDGKVEILPAAHLWGLSTSETVDLIYARMHDKWRARDTSVACIGPAGEKLARLASIVNDRHWAASRSGVGAVMGSKNLKAVAVYGTQDMALVSNKPFMDLIQGFLEQVKTMPLSSKTMPEQGTAFLVDMMNDLGTLATRNFQTGVFEGAGRINGKALQEISVRQMGCFSCPIGCEHIVPVGSRMTAMAPGYDELASLGSCCGVDDLEMTIEANHLCRELGLDPVSTGITISCAMEMTEKGLIPESETGASLRFGDSGAVLTMVKQMGRRSGFGDVLAEGAHRLAERHGHPELFMGAKKQECPPCDPRGIQGLGLQYATSNNGAGYDGGYTILEEVLGLHGEMDPREIKGKASLVKDMQDLAAVLDSTGVCLRMLFSGMATLEVFAMLEMAVAAGLTDKELLQVGERVFNLERLFNIRAGFDAGDDTLPRRMLEEPMSGGKAEGRVNRLAEMLSEYYQLRGWDAEGRPTAEKLAGLGLAGETATV